MAGPIDESQVRHIARLARLNLTDDEIQLFTWQLGRILDYVRQLEQVPTAGVAPLVHAFPVGDVLADDRPHACLPMAQALANAPQRTGPFFKVPKVLDQDGSA